MIPSFKSPRISDDCTCLTAPLRRLPAVPGLPRFTGGAVGYFGYGTSTWFEPVLGDLGTADDGADAAGFMLFDTVLSCF